jgi:hypothetical protein
MVPKARARKDTTPSARCIVDILIPLLLYILCLARVCDNEIKGAVEIRELAYLDLFERDWRCT